MNANQVRELGRATLSGSPSFPDIVRKLIANGVEYYHVDYVALQIGFYSAEGGFVPVTLGLLVIGGCPHPQQTHCSDALKSCLPVAAAVGDEDKTSTVRPPSQSVRHWRDHCPDRVSCR
jgi:hypothetical protein